MTTAQALRDLAQGMLPDGFGCEVLPVDGPASELLPAEQVAVARAIEKRRQEFAIGRTALRLAIRRAGHDMAANVPIAARPDRQPDLPTGIRASLSHSGGYCIAIAAPPGGPLIGVDIEPQGRPLPEGLEQVVAPYRMADDAPLLAFCVKEAMFKAQYPLTGRMLGFDAVPVVMRNGRARGCLGARLIAARWGIAADFYLAISLWSG